MIFGNAWTMYLHNGIPGLAFNATDEGSQGGRKQEPVNHLVREATKSPSGGNGGSRYINKMVTMKVRINLERAGGSACGLKKAITQ